MQQPQELAKQAPSTASTFLGKAISRYDVDELDALGKRPKLEKYVEVRRPDGTVAKARGERTFYGAFTGGFSAGYWNTVGSKEGWEPASFSSSRSKKGAAAAPRVEDYMDEEDLREHHASHRAIQARAEFAPRGGEGARPGARPCAVPGGLPREVEEQAFGPREARLGTRLLAAGGQGGASSSSAPPAAAEPAPAPRAAASGGKRRYGCAPPPADFRPPPAAAPAAEALEEAAAGSAQAAPAFRRIAAGAHTVAGASGRWPFEADLERLWRGKTDLHGIGYGTGSAQSSVGQVPEKQRLYMSRKRGANGGESSGYGAFGTGVFDMEDYDVWEDIYSGTGKKHCHEEVASQPETSQEDARAPALGPLNPGALLSGAPEGYVPGFVEAKELEDGDAARLPEWELPEAPRGFRGAHAYPGTWEEEARAGSSEHRRLLEFLEEHGDRRLMDPASRAALLGERARPVRGSAAAAAAGAGVADGAPPGGAEAAPGPGARGAEGAGAAAAGPLWRGVSDEQKRTLLQNLGRNFVVGQEQDMEGRLGRHEPFRSDGKKQSRYAAFCLALEGKASASKALEDIGGLSEAEREAELQEFGRVYRMFRTENPGVDIAAALESGSEAPGPPVLRRTVQAWTPARLLCRRWGVPEPHPPPSAASAEPAGPSAPPLSRAPAPAPAPGAAPATGSGPGAGAPAPVPAPAAATPGSAPAEEPPRPPRSLFASIFGDSAVSDEEG